MSNSRVDDATITMEKETPMLHWQKASGTTDPEALLARFDAVRAKTEGMTIPDTTETIRRSRDSGFARE